MKNGKIIWAVDPFATDKSLQREAAWALRDLARQQKREIQPVYALEMFPGNLPFEKPKDLIDQVTAKGQEELEEVLRRVKLPGLRPLRVLDSPVNTLRGRVDKLVAYAKAQGAELIVASTRARKGPSRWLTGSFAEALMLHSDVPLFLVNPSASVRAGDLCRILFPTDFSDQSQRAFEQVVGFAREIGGRITLYHKLTLDISPELGLALAAFPPFPPVPPQTLENEIRLRRKQASEWAAKAARLGVRVESFVDARVPGRVSDSILNYSKKGFGLIAMAARSGALAASLPGSTTRQVVRTLRGRRRRPASAPFTVTEEDIMRDLRDHGRRRGED
jgi:nucleotide-binding universal stress UspA family protein